MHLYHLEYSLNFYCRHDIQNLRQENELLQSGSEIQPSNRESISSDGCTQSMSGCHIDGATTTNWSNNKKGLNSKDSDESDQDGKF